MGGMTFSRGTPTTHVNAHVRFCVCVCVYIYIYIYIYIWHDIEMGCRILEWQAYYKTVHMRTCSSTCLCMHVCVKVCARASNTHVGMYLRICMCVCERVFHIQVYISLGGKSVTWPMKYGGRQGRFWRQRHHGAQNVF